MDTFIGTASQQELKDLVQDLNKLILEEWNSHRIWHFNGYRWLDELIELSSFQPFGKTYKRRAHRVEYLLLEMFKGTNRTRVHQNFDPEVINGRSVRHLQRPNPYWSVRW